MILRKFPGLLKSIFDVFPDFIFRYTFISDQKKTIPDDNSPKSGRIQLCHGADPVLLAWR
jgi:hypothetical protein